MKCLYETTLCNIKRYYLLACLCCFCIWNVSLAREMRFVVLTDLHIVPGNPNDLIFPEVVKDINRLNPDYIFVTGDLTNQGNDLELENVYQRLSLFKPPVYVIPGNHETTWSESAGKTFNRLWGSDRFLVEQDSMIFCGLSTGPYMRMSDGHVKAEDLNWLGEVLSTPAAQSKSIIFFCHYPIQDGLGNHNALSQILRKHKVQLAFCGHEHRFKLYNSDSIPQIVCHALRSREGKVGYTLVTLDNEIARCAYYLLNEAKADTVITADLKERRCLSGLPAPALPERIGGKMPRGWKAECIISEKTSFFTGIASSCDSVFLYGTSTGKLICREAAGNRLRWSYDTGHALFSTPLIYENQVIIGSSGNEILSVDLKTGKEKWRIPTQSPVTGEGAIEGSCLYIGAGSGCFLKIDLATGSVCWRFDGIRANGRLQGAPAVGADQVIFGAWDTYLYCLDKYTGKLRWKWNNGKEADLLSPGNIVPVIAGDRVLIVAPDRYISILNLEDGKTIFRTNRYKVRESLGYSADLKTAYAKTMDGELLSFSFPSDSVVNPVVSSLQIGYDHNPCLPLIQDGIVYSGSRKGEVIATRAKDNEFLWRFKCGNSSVLKLIPVGANRVIANLTEGTVWQFTKSDPEFVIRQDQPVYPSGLTGKHIALWPSHGFYYNQEQQRWMWQRARCFGSVEDISIMSYVQPFLVPMLENSGASVMMPRERDLQSREVVVDRDGSDGKSEITCSGGRSWSKKEKSGFKKLAVIKDSINPFKAGTHIKVPVLAKRIPRISYIPQFPQTGEYAVYISYAKSEKPVKAHYEVRHSGGKATFIVDQSKGGALFHYLGTFLFEEGKNARQGAVIVTPADPEAAGFLTSDAIRFGGGMGNIARNAPLGNADISAVPRYAEAARYFLQYGGLPPSVYSPDQFKNDYTDDYKCRGAWVNYLMGQGIEIDGVLAFHTDAGTAPKDSIIGTLAICSTKKGSLQGMMSDTVSRVLSEYIQTQLVNDIRKICTPEWTRRSLWDKPYYEAWMPEAPTLLLELLSHQNLGDMRYGLDPRFRFIVSRAIYKGMGRFLAELRGDSFTVHPLPPVDFAIRHEGDKKISFQWNPRIDPIEPTAVADTYLFYVACEDGGWQTPISVSKNEMTFELPDYGKRYRFKVSALNTGGESFCTEELSACIFKQNPKPALIVNGFTRIGAPAFFDEGNKAGIAWWQDEGVAWNTEFAFVGYQYDFDRSSKWISDDAPGWGASGVEGWTRLIAGNKFNYPFVHGEVFQRNKCSYISCSRAAFEKDGNYNPEAYRALDLLFGEQRACRNFKAEEQPAYPIFTPAMQARIESFAKKQIPLLISWAYIASDLMFPESKQTESFAREVLHFKPVGNFACKDGRFTPADKNMQLSAGNYNVSFSPDYYRVEAPDALSVADSSARTLYRYTENGLSAGIYKQTNGKMVILGFPFESVLQPAVQDEILHLILPE
ncbi:MAG: PQQ-binding-like beta-propeller repeat protein [Bacteroidales bacterium]